MQKIKVGRHKPRGYMADNPHRDFMGIKGVEISNIQPPPDRKEGWLGNPPWLKDKNEKTKEDR